MSVVVSSMSDRTRIRVKKTFVNKNYKHDIEYAIKLSRFVFRLLGIWPYARTNPRFPDTLERVVVVLVSYIILMCETLPAILFIIIVQRETRARLKVITVVIFSIVAMAKYTQLLFNRNLVRSCLAQIENDWRNVAGSSDRDVMIGNTRIGRRLLIICAVFMYITVVSFRTIVPLSRGKIVTPQNITIRSLPCPSYPVLFDVQITPAYEIVFLVQFFSGFIKSTITTAAAGLAGSFVMHTCAQLEILMTLMNNLVNDGEIKNVNERLATIVKHQLQTRNFLELVQNVIQYISLIEVTGGTIVLCLVGYLVIMEWEDSNAVALCTFFIGAVSIGFNIFIFCFIGEQLHAKGEQVALTLCTLDWYRLPDATARSLILIIIMSNSPIKLRAGKIIELSFRTFGNVLKTAATYLNLLRSVVD